MLVLVASAAIAEEMIPGLPRQRVEERLGPPTAIRLERNRVVCWVYALERDRHLKRLIVLRHDHVLEDATVRTEHERFHCAQAAERWDHQRKKPLVCDSHWSRFC